MSTSIEEEKVSVTIISWKKALIGATKLILVLDILLIALILYVFSLLQDPTTIFRFKIIVVVGLIGQVGAMIFMAPSLRKKRVDVDSSGVFMHFGKLNRKIDWRDVISIEISNEKRTLERKVIDYYKITVADIEDFRYNEIFAEKTKKLEAELATHYRAGITRLEKD